MGSVALRRDAPVLPTVSETELAKQSGRQLAACLTRGTEPRIQVYDGEKKIDVPLKAMHMLADILQHMGEGHALTLMPHGMVLTTQQAADLLNVSRPYLVKLVEQGKIKATKVGRHRRIAFTDLMEYRRGQDESRDAALAELAAIGQELGVE